MFKPFALYIGLRYTRAKRRTHFISFISLVSMIGIALGVTVLITVLSVMNGFDIEIKTKIFGMARQVAVNGIAGSISDWQSLEKKILKQPDVKAVAPYIDGQGMLTNKGVVQPMMMIGIVPSIERKVSTIDTKMVEGSMDSLQSGTFGVVLGSGTASVLGVKVGDKVTLITPETSMTPIGIIPRYKRFTVVGIFHVGGGFGFDRGIGFINLHDAQKLYQLGGNVTGLRLRVDDLNDAPLVARNLTNTLPGNYLVRNWTQDYGAFFQAIQLEKTMMFIILMLIIAVAAFNLVSSLMMVVTDKRAEIAILRTFGCSPKTVMAIFMVQGCVVGVVGTIFGLIGGILLSLNVTYIAQWLQETLHMTLIPASVYFIDYLPSKIQGKDLFHVCLIALTMSLVATLYPSWRASRTQPAEALRYE